MPEQLPPLYEICGSRTRTKILKVFSLAKKEELQVSMIVRRVNVSIYACRKHLKILKEQNVIGCKKHGHFKWYRMHIENKKIRKLRDFFIFWEQ